MATTNQSSDVPVFMGEFCHAIDGKRRITIPSPWRFEDEVELFLIPSISSKCLKVIPRPELDRIRADAAKLTGPQRTAFLRHFGSMGRQCTVDKAGRLSLPEEFCLQFKLESELTLSGAIESFEIWNTDEWRAAHEKTKAVAEALMPDFGL